MLRWIALGPVAVLSWYMGLFVGIAIYELGESVCPKKFIDSGMCFASWIGIVHTLAHIFGAATAAYLIVILSYKVAPSHNKIIGLVALITGALVATVMVIATKAWIPYCSALTSGALAYLLINRSTPAATTH